MIIKANDRATLAHYGIQKKSGRYPWGSGETPYERALTFQSMLKDLRRQGVSDTDIAKGFGMTTPELRDTVTIAHAAKKTADIARARQLKNERGLSNVAIGKKMGINESSVRDLLKEGAADSAEILEATTEMLRTEVAKKKYIDVGKGVELQLAISEKKLKTAVSVLKNEGYTLHYLKVPQVGTGKNTSLKVLAAPGVLYGEVSRNRDQIQQLRGRSTDGGRSFDRIMPPISIDPKRLKVRYAEEGGTNADGVIYVRPGVKDVSLGRSNYAQVRVAVGGTHYLKGMAMYKDDLPEGVDLMFNTNKSDTGNKLDALKPMKTDKLSGEIDKDDPFGSQISDQVYKKRPDGSYVLDSNGDKIVESAMNIVNEEGDWNKWSKTLSSQFLSKQKHSLAEHQLALARKSKEEEFKEIMGLTNPTVQKHLLEKFADSADSSAVHLKAAHLPRQATKVILPIESMKPTEIYAPTFDDGERVVLVRFPHAGIFEIPELRVNNRHPEAHKLLGNAPDAVGIHPEVAERLSGADFDGDSVLVIPNNLGKVKSGPPLQGLKGFDPKTAYPKYEGMAVMTAKQKGQQMGKVSNLITDMQIKGAPDTELERAVRHSMVVIDAEKHGLDWQRSAVDNGISSLMKKYQEGKAQGGASTIVSRAKSELRVPDRKLRRSSEGGHIDPKTGKLIYVETGVEYGPGNPKTIKSTKLAETDDARTLVSDPTNRIEKLYAEHSNSLKDLANRARLQLLKAKDIERSPSAAKFYAEDVKDLDAALNDALRNAPHERQAQLIANAIIKQKMMANPDMDKAEIKKLKAKEIAAARARVGAKKKLIEISPRQWEAIQAGAISKTKLEAILDNADLDKIKELATPKDKPVMDEGMKTRAVELLRNDKYTLAEVANQLGVSVSTLTSSLSGVDHE